MRFHEEAFPGPRTSPIGAQPAMRHRKWLEAVALSAVFLAPAVPAFAAPLYIDFGSYSGAPSSLFGAAAVAAGVWNHIPGLGTTADLIDVSNNASGVSVTVAAEFTNGTGGFGTGDAVRMMQDNFYSTPGVAWTVSFAGLTRGLYDVYLYEPMNQFLGIGSGSVNGTAFTSINGGFTGTFTPNVNYLLLTDVLVTNGTLIATASDARALTGLAGLQLVDKSAVPVPEPGTLALVTAALAAASLRPRRLRRSFARCRATQI